MKKFTLHAPYTPTGDQPEAIAGLLRNIEKDIPEQVLLGVTGSGKTFTIANVIEKLQRPTLVISHNKTLAGQLYQEFRDYFPDNAVSYFVSYYDYYQPEAYIPQSDTYIEKETQINEELDKLRLAATTNILMRPDTIVVASVSSIYNIGSPKEYGHFVLELAPGMKISRESILERLVQLQYERSDFGFHRSTFRVRGEAIDLFTAYEDSSLRIITKLDKVVKLVKFNPITGKTLEDLTGTLIYPAKHYMTDPRTYKDVFAQIRADVDRQEKDFNAKGKIIEAHRIRQRVDYDLDMIEELGYVNGVENYSRYFDGRNPGDPPYTLLDYFEEGAIKHDNSKWLLVIDESHMTIPQIRGMYNGDRSRKQTLIDYGFRLPSALDNRPLRFEEFLRHIPQTIYLSATPDEWELTRIPKNGVIEQIIRPTGLVDPTISVRPTEGQIPDLMNEIKKRTAVGQRVLVTTLTKRMSEDLAKYLEDQGINVRYLHSDIETLKRTDILAELRHGAFDVLVGINLLREGLDLPEVSLVAILDADKEGFLRSAISLIQTMGRAARHLEGHVILYADTMTRSMKLAISEGERRRTIQLAYNASNHIDPQSIHKPIRSRLVDEEAEEKSDRELVNMNDADIQRMTPQDKQLLIKKLTRLMSQASRELDFEHAAKIHDLIQQMDD